MISSRSITTGLLTLLTVLAGCQTGRVDHVAFSEDGWVVAFTQFKSETICVADRDRVRRLRGGQETVVLSRDGRYVASTAERIRPHGVPRFWLHDLAAEKSWRIRRPRLDVDWELAGRWLLCEGPAIAVEIQPAEDVDQPPTPPPHRWRVWTPSQDWRDVGADPPPRMAVRQLGPRSDADPLVCFPPDGRNDQRTVWVRPDGSTMEIARRNDAVPRHAWAILISPVTVWDPDGSDGCWTETREDYKARNQGKAHARLMQLVAERKASAPAQPASTTQPDESEGPASGPQ